MRTCGDFRTGGRRTDELSFGVIVIFLFVVSKNLIQNNKLGTLCVLIRSRHVFVTRFTIRILEKLYGKNHSTNDVHFFLIISRNFIKTK